MDEEETDTEEEVDMPKMAVSKKPKKPKTKTTSKKNTTSKKKTLEKPDEDKGLDTCTIVSQKTNKERCVKVLVKWKKWAHPDWQYLYDMWADYPQEVVKYQNKNKNKCRGKIWKTPKLDDVTYFVRILGMIGEVEDVKQAQFIVLANNGYKFDGEESVKYDELQRDDPELLTDYLDSIKVSSETDDATVLSVTVATDDATVLSVTVA